MTGALIIPKDNYPVQGNAEKVISYESSREIYFCHKKNSPMESSLNINNYEIENLPLPISGHQATNKDYVDNNSFKQNNWRFDWWRFRHERAFN